MRFARVSVGVGPFFGKNLDEERSERIATGCYGKFARAKFENLIWLNCGSFIDLNDLYLFCRRGFRADGVFVQQSFCADRVFVPTEFLCRRIFLKASYVQAEFRALAVSSRRSFVQ